jgi:hypothetical protein
MHRTAARRFGQRPATPRDLEQNQPHHGRSLPLASSPGKKPPHAFQKKAFSPRFLLKSELFLAHFQPVFEAVYDTFKSEYHTK